MMATADVSERGPLRRHHHHQPRPLSAPGGGKRVPLHSNGKIPDQSQEEREQEFSSRTSLSLTARSSDTESWMSTTGHADPTTTTITSSSKTGVEVPPLLQTLFGLEFLPFSTILEDEAGEADAATEGDKDQAAEDVPRSVEIASDNSCEVATLKQGVVQQQQEEAAEVCEVHRHPIERAATPEREELQQMLLHCQQQQQYHKKKRPGKRVKAAVRGVFQRLGRRRGGGARSVKSLTMIEARDDNSHALAPLSPTTPTTEASRSPVNIVNQHPSGDVSCCSSSIILEETKSLQHEAQLQEENVRKTQEEIEKLQTSLAASLEKYQSQLESLQKTQQQLQQQAEKAKAQSSQVLLHQQSCPANLDFQKAITTIDEEATEPNKNPRALRRSESASFMRVSDLDLASAAAAAIKDMDSNDVSVSSLSQSAHSSRPQQQNAQALFAAAAATASEKTPEFLLMDHYLLEIVQQLLLKGYNLITDEARFTPTKETEKLLAQKPASVHLDPNWPIQPWTVAWDGHVLVWTGQVPHEGFGSGWPVVKGRAIMYASAETVLDYLWDSKQVPKYNPLSQGREDIYILQDKVNTTAEESPYGLAGGAKIVQAHNKHRLLPKTMEIKSLLYARPLEEHEGSYILVSRSVWENSTATLESQPKNVIRSEMLLGCTLLRAIDARTCEMTQLTHAYSPGVPEMLVRRVAPGQCSSLMKALQEQFPPPPPKK